MIRSSGSRLVVINLLVALAISLVINMSYLLLIIRQQNESETSGGQKQPESEVRCEGRVEVNPDGYAYLHIAGQDPSEADTVYISARMTSRSGINTGDIITAEVLPPRRDGAHKILGPISSINGEPYEAPIFQRPNEWSFFTLDMIYYLALSFILLMVATFNTSTGMAYGIYVRRVLLCIIIAFVAYLLAPIFDWRTGKMLLNVLTTSHVDTIPIIKCSFSLVVSILYGYIYQLVYQKQRMELENEKLMNENLRTRYDMLMNQISPHFLFNSLNSLAMLVRDSQVDNALTYIDRLSYTFRYIIQNERNTMTTLNEELRFLDSYKYMFEIRYADKIVFDIAVDETRRKWLLPVLSLMPLVENAVKHNTITRNETFVISIRTDGDTLTISNPIRPKIEKESSTGTGLRNLSNRWALIAGKNIEVADNGSVFSVRMPLTPPKKQS